MVFSNQIFTEIKSQHKIQNSILIRITLYHYIAFMFSICTVLLCPLIHQNSLLFVSDSWQRGKNKGQKAECARVVAPSNLFNLLLRKLILPK